MSFTLCKPGEDVVLDYREITPTAGAIVIGDRVFLFRRGYNFVKLNEEERAFIAENLKDMTQRFGYRPMTNALQDAILGTIRDVLLRGAERFAYELQEGELCVVDEHFRWAKP